MKAVLEFDMTNPSDKDTFVNCYKGDVYAEAIALFGQWLMVEMKHSEDRYSEEQYATLKLVSDKFFNDVQSVVERE